MDVASIPFNKLIGLERCTDGSDLLVSLPSSPMYTNHLGTVHASALLAVAEAGSAEFLIRQIGNISNLVPVVRRIEAKFKNPANGQIFARSQMDLSEIRKGIDTLNTRGRAMISVEIEVVDESRTICMVSTVEWFVSKTSNESV